jgi:serine/threonine protein kinase
MASERIIGSYCIEEPIGRGGMGVVYRGHHLQLPREVAIKSIDAQNSRALQRLQHRFEKEAFVQSQLDHPGIVKVYDYIVDEHAYYIVMEYVEGRSLAQLLSREASPLNLNRALDFFEQILAAISYAHTFVYLDRDGSSHRGLVHRDLKPANILITPEGNVKITDFGIVKLIGAEATDTLSDHYGSPEYVSPEQAEGRAVDQRSDIYSLGIILYEMLTGTPPFWNKTGTLSHTDIIRMHIEETPQPPSERHAQVTPEIEAVILRALEKRPEARFTTAQEFLQAVRRMRGLAALAPAQQLENRLTVELNDDAGTANDKQSSMPIARESYETQRIGSHTCDDCGAFVAPEDETCSTCGRELNPASATVKLTLKEAAGLQKRRALDIWVAASLCVIALITFFIFYARRMSSSRQEAQPPSSTLPEAPKPTPVPASALVELKPARVLVDSSFDGYNAAPLTDGETDVRRIAAMRYNAGNWVSAETPDAHWIELDFGAPTRVAAVYLYWGFDRNRFMPSRLVTLETLADNSGDGSERWNTISSLEPGSDYDRTAFEFAPVSTTRLRILQPTRQGPVSRPFVMWLREVKVFGAEEDRATP